MDSIVETLRSLRDIKGIQGSFVVGGDDGRLLGRDLTAVIDDDTLAQVGPRIDRLLDIIDDHPPTESIALRFGDQRLDIRRVGSVNLCVLAESSISPPALRMAMKLVSRKLEAHDWTPRSAAPAAPAVPATSEPPASRTIQFRGVRSKI
jgi:hypothetical protein